MHHFFHGKKGDQNVGFFRNSQKLPLVSNHPMGKKLPNLVTLGPML
jgi:hypothetical protein